MADTKSSLEDILNELNSNLSFREKFNKDPEKALIEYNFEVSDDVLNKIKAVVKESDILNKRINK